MFRCPPRVETLEKAPSGSVGRRTGSRVSITGMIRRNANLYPVKELLGHEDVGTLAGYVKLTIVDLKEAHKRFHPREREEAKQE